MPPFRRPAGSTGPSSADSRWSWSAAPDPDGVAIQGWTLTAHASAFDLSVFGFEPQPIEAAAP